MAKIRPAGFSADRARDACASLAGAADISTKKLFHQRHLTKPEKRTGAGASRLTPACCSPRPVTLARRRLAHHPLQRDRRLLRDPAAGPRLEEQAQQVEDKSKVTKSSAQIKNAKLPGHDHVGRHLHASATTARRAPSMRRCNRAGTRFCMRCTGNKKNQATKVPRQGLWGGAV